MYIYICYVKFHSNPFIALNYHMSSSVDGFFIALRYHTSSSIDSFLFPVPFKYITRLDARSEGIWRLHGGASAGGGL